MQPRGGFTVMEVLLAVALVALAAGLLTLELRGVRPAAEASTRAQQQRALQDALDRWLASEPTLASARGRWDANEGEDTPGDARGFLRDHVLPRLAPGTGEAWLEHADEEGWYHPLFDAHQEYLRPQWPEPWRENTPRVERAPLRDRREREGR